MATNSKTTIKEETSTEKPVKVSNPRKKKTKLPSDMLVECKNITMGKLIYISKRQNGYTIIWSNPGDVEEIELSELLSMRNSQPKFFEKNWIGIEDPDVINYLKVGKYYENVPDFDKLDEILSGSFEDLREMISKLPKSAYDTVSFKATEMINDGTIDSMKTIKFLCEALGLVLDE